MSFYQCLVCKDQLFNTPSYKTVDGKVCEDCYESRKGEKSAYDFYLEEKLSLVNTKNLGIITPLVNRGGEINYD